MFPFGEEKHAIKAVNIYSLPFPYAKHVSGHPSRKTAVVSREFQRETGSTRWNSSQRLGVLSRVTGSEGRAEEQNTSVVLLVGALAIVCNLSVSSGLA